MAIPRNLALSEADARLGVPVGVVEAWVTTGLLRPVWFVYHGVIVRGVRTEDARNLRQAARCAAARRRAGLAA